MAPSVLREAAGSPRRESAVAQLLVVRRLLAHDILLRQIWV